MTALLELHNVTKVFGGGVFRKSTTLAVDDISLSISGDPPGITTIAGESGSGKTTLARLLMGIASATSGEVFYMGQNIKEMSGAERREFRREVQPIFQDPFEVYNPFYKVDHVLTTPVANFHLAGSKAEARTLITEALETVGLRPEETLGRFPHQLSGGQRQRVMVARALLLKPRVIIADEPVSMVDASLRATILESVRTLNRELGIAVVYITHDLTTAFQISDNIVVLYQGSIAEAGSVEQVIGEPKHPYTKLLVESIPQADPKRKWGEGMAPHDTGGATAWMNRGCKFAPRCPFVLPVCHDEVPPLFRTDDTRAAACHLYRESKVLDPRQIASVFADSVKTAGADPG